MNELVTYVTNKKQNMSVAEICRRAPEQIRQCLQHVRDLAFEQEPDYEMM